jgi:2-dehydropantoate 2-reductase
MRVAIYGSGGVGGYFGGLLAQAGHAVTFLARGDHLRAIQQDGLRVLSANGDFHIHPARATDDPAQVGPVDTVIVAVKHYHLGEVVARLAGLVGPQTMVAPLLNGVDAPELLTAAVRPGAVIGGLCSLVALVESPGVIRQPSRLRRVVLGELDGAPSPRVARLVEALAACGVDAVQSADIQAAMWSKFVFIASFGGITSLARATAGEVRQCPETRALLAQAMGEVEAVGRAQGIRLAPDVVAGALATVDAFEAGATSSMQRDVAAGRPFELDAFSGEVVRRGLALGAPTPVHRAIYALLRPALLRAGQVKGAATDAQ